MKQDEFKSEYERFYMQFETWGTHRFLSTPESEFKELGPDESAVHEEYYFKAMREQQKNCKASEYASNK